MEFKKGICKNCKKKTMIDKTKGWWHSDLCNDCINLEGEKEDERHKLAPCSYENKEGTIINTCEDLPVTYCKKCKTFYVVTKLGHEEIMSNKEEEVFG